MKLNFKNWYHNFRTFFSLDMAAQFAEVEMKRELVEQQRIKNRLLLVDGQMNIYERRTKLKVETTRSRWFEASRNNLLLDAGTGEVIYTPPLPSEQQGLLPSQVDSEVQLLDHNGKWIDEIIDVEEPTHIGIFGTTGSGKSTLVNYLSSRLYEEKGHNVFVCDPDYKATDSEWYIEPVAKIGEECLPFIKEFASDITKRQLSDIPMKDYSTDWVVLDEANSMFETYEKDIKAPMDEIHRRGRKRKKFLIALGQSHLVKEIGLSTASRQNFTLIFLKKIGVDYLSNLSMDKTEKAALLSIANRLLDSDVYFGVVVPKDGKPSIKLLPDLSNFGVQKGGKAKVQINDSEVLKQAIDVIDSYEEEQYVPEKSLTPIQYAIVNDYLDRGEPPITEDLVKELAKIHYKGDSSTQGTGQWQRVRTALEKGAKYGYLQK